MDNCFPPCTFTLVLRVVVVVGGGINRFVLFWKHYSLGIRSQTAFDEGFPFPPVQDLERHITAALPRVLWHGPDYVIWMCVCGVATFLLDQISTSLSGRSKCGDWSCTIKHLRAWCPAAERDTADKSCCCRLREVYHDEDDEDSSKWSRCDNQDIEH